MSRLAIWFNIGWNNISYSKSIYRVKREREGTTLDLASAVMAENGCMRVGQTSSVYTLPAYIRGERSEHLKICGTRPMNIPNAKTQR